MAQIKQYFDIKFPFTSNNLDGFFIDLNKNMNDKVLSEILHVIMTPKGGRLRMPDFGTDLVHYIFDQSDEKEWARIKSEIKDAVAKYVPKASLNDIRVLREEGNDNTILVDLDYSVSVGLSNENNRVVIKI